MHYLAVEHPIIDNCHAVPVITMSGRGKLFPKSSVSLFRSPCIKVAFSIPFLAALRRASVTASCTSSKPYTCFTLYKRNCQCQNFPKICMVEQNRFPASVICQSCITTTTRIPNTMLLLPQYAILTVDKNTQV